MVCALGGGAADLSGANFSDCLWLSLELAGDFGEEFEGETSSRLPVTDATFAVARLAALDSVGPIQAVLADAVFVSIIVLILVELAE